jgi:hypothetical protein
VSLELFLVLFALPIALLVVGVVVLRDNRDGRGSGLGVVAAGVLLFVGTIGILIAALYLVVIVLWMGGGGQ